MRLDAITTAESVADFCELHCRTPRQQSVADHRQVATWQQSQQQQGWSITGQRSQCSPQDKVIWQALSEYGQKSIKRRKDLYTTWWSGPADGCQLLRQKLPWSRMRRSPNGLSTSVLSWLKRCKQFSFDLLSGLYNRPSKGQHICCTMYLSQTSRWKEEVS